MQYRIVFLAALSATGALARPALRRDDHMMEPTAPQGGFADIDFSKYECPQEQMGSQLVTIGLAGPDVPLKETELKSDNGKFVFCPTNFYGEISVKVDANVNNADLRCAVADEEGKMIGASRGANLDFTFSDGGKALKWDFLLTPKEIAGDAAAGIKRGIKTSKVVCDPEFKKIDDAQKAKEQEVNVLLRPQAAGEATIIGPFTGANNDESKQVDPMKTYETIEVKVGRLTSPQGLRCTAVLEENGLSRFAKRGANIDNTFSDNEAGEWTFSVRGGAPKPATGLSSIRCDQDFFANNQNTQTTTPDNMNNQWSQVMNSN